mgnify:CR=1 FL=1
MNKYSPKKIEAKWQKIWEEKNIFVAEDFSKKPKKYILVEFPYPSGAGLHVGHVRSYTALDVVARKSRMEGYNTMYPIGWDAFGLPTENYAIKHGIHPKEATEKNIATYKKQLKSLGISYDWSREINTTDPQYYKWTQWIFLKFLEKGLAYKHKMPVNWCNSCKIVLANEEVVEGRCERCGGEVEKREKEQWMLKITEYADRLIDDLDEVDYLDKIKTQQKNWIGRSEGAEISFKLNKKNNYVLLHGYKGSVKNDFFPWLKKYLKKNDCKVCAIDIPGGSKPKVKEQIKFLKKNCKFDENTVVVTHSLGGPLLLKYLESTGDKIFKAIMIAPPSELRFLDDKQRPALNKFCDWKFNYPKIKNHIKNTIILIDSADPIVPKNQPEHIAKELDANKLYFKRNNHFNQDDISEIKEVLFEQLKVFTSRPDTLYGATYMVVAPEHELIKDNKSRIENYVEIKKYINNTKKKSDLERTELQKEKTGVELQGIKAINPINNEEIPIFVADYVLSTYGTGAIMAVPAHDQRDFEFAKKYNLPINYVVASLFIDKTGKDAVRSDKKTVRRDVAYSFVKHWKEDKYLCLDWKKFNWHSGVIGGIDEGEDIIEAGKREITEETGYKNLKLIKKLPGEFHSNFYAQHKGVNRYAQGYGLLFELENSEKVATKEEDTKNHKAVWVDKKEMSKFLNLENNIIMWNMLMSGEEVFTGEGISINSELINNLKTKDAKKIITDWLEKNNYGKKSVNYKLRDWIFSRQHYWGEPIPVIYCDICGTVPVPEKDLPVELPEVKKYEPTDTGESPLAAIKDWVNVKCPKCSADAKRETDTMPNWAGSSWYYLRYCDPKNENKFVDSKKLKYWMPVDWYNGGMEHTTLHLLYSRFWHKFLFDQGLVSTSEPYAKRTSHGIVLAEDGRKMSKSFDNVINPDDIVENEEGGGADTLRLYELFMGPFSEAIPWSMDGVKGIRRFLEKVWNIFCEKELIDCGGGCEGVPEKLSILLHKTIKKVTEDIGSMDFNTAISQMMIFINEVYKHDQVPRGALEKFLVLLSPFAPHMTEELWEKLGNKKSITTQSWPTYNEKLLTASEINLVVQINGRVRDTVSVNSGISEADALGIAKKSVKVIKYIKNKEINKVIYIQDKILNLVV